MPPKTRTPAKASTNRTGAAVKPGAARAPGRQQQVQKSEAHSLRAFMLQV